MAVGDAHGFPGFLTPVLTQLFFPKPPTTFLTYFCRSDKPKYAGKKVCSDQGSNSQPAGHESHMLTTELPRRGSITNYPPFILNQYQDVPVGQKSAHTAMPKKLYMQSKILQQLKTGAE